MARGNGGKPGTMGPLRMLWMVIYGIAVLIARFFTALFGLAVLTLGLVLSLTIIGAVIGLPLIFSGISLMARAFY